MVRDANSCASSPLQLQSQYQWSNCNSYNSSQCNMRCFKRINNPWSSYRRCCTLYIFCRWKCIHCNHTAIPALLPDTYLSVRDANGCVFSTSATITNTGGPTAIAATIVNAACGASNGSITLGAVTGGVAPYTYSVNGSAFTATTSYTSLAAGTYPYKVRDANSCDAQLPLL